MGRVDSYQFTINSKSAQLSAVSFRQEEECELGEGNRKKHNRLTGTFNRKPEWGAARKERKIRHPFTGTLHRRQAFDVSFSKRI
jgi:hypothetical protein